MKIPRFIKSSAWTFFVFVVLPFLIYCVVANDAFFWFVVSSLGLILVVCVVGIVWVFIDCMLEAREKE